MSGYIDADKLLDEFCGDCDCEECEWNLCGDCTEKVSFKELRNRIEKVKAADAEVVIKCKGIQCPMQAGYNVEKCNLGELCQWYMPVSSDVVEVVRCKDCEHSNYAELTKYRPIMCYCANWEWYTAIDGYCYYGNKKDGRNESRHDYSKPLRRR